MLIQTTVQRRSGGSGALYILFGSLIIAGVVMVSYGLLHQPQPPAPEVAAAGYVDTPLSTVSAQDIPGMPMATPQSLKIPSINVSTPMTQVDLNPDGSPGVPSGGALNTAAWLKTSPAPGSTGNAIIVGHVKTAQTGPAIFFNLGKLAPGQKIYISRSDGHTAVFDVTAVSSYPKDAFPDSTVYGSTPDAELRLITCGGDWDAAQGKFSNNVVAFAKLSGSY
jgi:hypothetical protein